MSTVTGLSGARTTLRFYLRRDRWMLLWWTVGITLLYWSQAISVQATYTTQAEFDKAAVAMQANPAFLAMTGPPRALNTVGGQVTWQASALGVVTIALMVMFLLGRHTRAEEESGRDELLRAAPVDRTTPMLTAVLECLLASVVVGAAVSVSLVAFPLAVADSVALGVGLTLSGWLFTAVALVMVQLTTSPRAAYGLTGTVIGLAYLLRAVGDVTGSGLSWASPIGWYQAMHPFSGLRWWPVLLLLAATVPVGALALALFDRRDHGSGLLAGRPGPAHTDLGALGLVWRLHRGSVIGWSAGLALTGLSYGSIGDSPGDLLGDSETAQQLFGLSGGDIVDSFYSAAMPLLALIAGGFAISSALRPHGEEERGRVESLLTSALPRRSWLLGHLLVTVLGTVLVCGLAGLGMGVGYAATTGDASVVLPWTAAMLAWSAPVLALVGLTCLVYGLLPRLATLAWLGLVFCLVVMLFGEAFSLPTWLRDVSPFEHLARVPAEDFRWTPVVLVLAVAAALGAAGLAAFSRRDVR